MLTVGEFHDQGDAKWIVIRGQLRGHNDTPFGRLTPGQPIGRPVVGCHQGIFGVLYYLLVLLIFNIVPLIMEFAGCGPPMKYGLGCCFFTSVG
jgi:hypothetical protein